MKINIYNVLIILALLGVSKRISAQQLPHLSMFTESHSFWNPAMTAPGNDFVADVFVRRQWLGFADAPLTGFVGVQMPFDRYNMSAGGYIFYDKTGPISKFGANFNYAYKIKEMLGDYSQLSLGLNAGLQQYAYSGSNLIVNDPNDQLLNIRDNSAFFPSFSVGFYYLSDTRSYRADNTTFIGLSINQILKSNLLVRDWNQVRNTHLFFNFGTRLYSTSSFFEPSLAVNYVSPEIMDILLNVKVEFRDLFWAGLGYSSVNELTIQGGYIVKDPAGKYTSLRLGVLANIGANKDLSRFGPGMELFVRYMFETK